MKQLKQFFNWYFRKSVLPYWCILLLDVLIIWFSGLFAYYLFNGGYQMTVNFYSLTHSLLIAIVVSVVTFRIFRTYTGIVRYSSFADLQHVAFANLTALLMTLALHYILLPFWEESGLSAWFTWLPPRVLITLYILATLLMGGVRVLVKTLFEISTRDSNAVPVLIYGAMTGGVGIAKNLRSQKPAKYLLRGFISHDSKLASSTLLQEPVYTKDDDLRSVIRQRHIRGLIVSPYRMKNFRAEQEFQDMLISEGVKIYMAQSAREWTGTDDDFSQIRLKEVSIEDLLPRDEIKISLEEVEKMLKGTKVLITGSAGSIGSEMVRQVAKFHPAAMMLIDQAETPQHDVRLMMKRDFPYIPSETVVTSITDHDRMEHIFGAFRPDYVFHAAAYKHVPMMEDNPSEAVYNNIYGTKVIADLSVKYGVKKFVMVSTDKAVNPTNVMGCSKRICEIYVQSLNKAITEGSVKGSTQFVTTRFGNVLGSNGSVIPLFKEQLKNGGPLTVTHPDIIRYFMLISEACKLVLEAGVMGKGGEIFVFDMGNPVKIFDLARRMILLSGADNVKITFTGLRDGEKLYEEVLNEQERVKPTFHEKIKIAEVREYEYTEADREICDLIAIAHNYNDMDTVRKMKEIVPEYKSNHSKYEVLDTPAK